MLLHYFGEASPECGNCDNCLQPPEVWDGTEAARKLMSAMVRTGQRFGAGHLIDVLRGRRTARIEELGHDRLPTFGIGADLDDAHWRSVVRQLVAMGLVLADPAQFGAYRLTEAARPVLRGEQTLTMRLPRGAPPARTRRGSRAAAAAGSSSAPAGSPQARRLEALRAWRRRTAQAQNVPAYVIFQDSTLLALVEDSPATLAELAGIPGIGARKLSATARNCSPCSPKRLERATAYGFCDILSTPATNPPPCPNPPPPRPAIRRPFRACSATSAAPTPASRCSPGPARR